jgi:type IV secretion system protein VirB6
MAPCSETSAVLGLAIRIYDAVDCRAQTLGRSGFDALAGSSLFAQCLSALMMIAVGLVGYRMILGQVPTTRNAVLWVARIGVVLALTTGWAAYGTLFHRVAFDGPGEVTALLLPAAALGDPYQLVGRVQAGYDAIAAAGQAASQNDPSEAPPAPAGVDPVAAPAVPPVGGDRSFRPLAFSAAGSVLLVMGLGSLLAARLASGLLLALGPLFVATLLLDATIGLFEGWLRALAVALLASIGTTAMLSIELDVLAGEMARIRQHGAEVAADPTSVLTIVALFGIVLMVVWLASLRAAGRIRLPRTIHTVLTSSEIAAPAHSALPAPAASAMANPPPVVAGSMMRVRTVTEAIARRDRHGAGALSQGRGTPIAATTIVHATGDTTAPAATPHTPATRRPNWRQNTA